ncbi:MAG: hypothetical protein IPK66_14325 [Rhodospirillales bacterium]|nr:hypothetical protein [Rhodospirillales bacterium]
MSRQFPFVVKSAQWRASDLLAGLSEDESLWTRLANSPLSPTIWHDTLSEYDAHQLYEYLKRRHFAASAEFATFLERWIGDERNHYAGFRFLSSHAFGYSESDIDASVRGRSPDFSGIEPWICDEFRLCVLLCYDECTTARGYKLDVPAYDTLDRPSLSKWVRAVMRDEVYHFANLASLIRLKFSHRVGEIERLLIDIANYQRSRPEYRATFVLDQCSSTALEVSREGAGYALLRAVGAKGREPGEIHGERRV